VESICPRVALNYVLGESRVVHIALLLGLQVYAGSFEAGRRGEMACWFFQGRCLLGLGSVWCSIGKLSMG
jgi:hypothetical protein